jgi:hypothetical protein
MIISCGSNSNVISNVLISSPPEQIRIRYTHPPLANQHHGNEARLLFRIAIETKIHEPITNDAYER